MKSRARMAALLSGILLLASSVIADQATRSTRLPETGSKPWVSAYYAGAAENILSPGDIDFRAVSHLLYFGAMARADGSLDLALHQVESPRAKEIVRRAHEAGRKALLSIGIESDHAAAAAASAHRARLVREAMAVLERMGFDGLDIDWEPFKKSHVPNYSALIRDLRKALGPKRLLSAAVADQPKALGQLAPLFDQINLMSYDLGGDWSPSVWHHAALRTPKGLATEDYPSADSMVHAFAAAGVPRSKLGVGIGFYGYYWRKGQGTPTGGVTAPLQKWSEPPTVDVSLNFMRIHDDYLTPTRLRWDGDAEASYLSNDAPGWADDYFISFEDERACAAKVRYVRKNGLGGVMIWELNLGWLTGPNRLVRDPLLQAIKKELE